MYEGLIRSPAHLPYTLGIYFNLGSIQVFWNVVERVVRAVQNDKDIHLDLISFS